MSKKNLNEDAQWTETGTRAFAASQYEEAIKIWTRVLAGNPYSPVKPKLAEAHFRRALDLYRNRGHINAIIADLTFATRYAPERAIYWYHLGLASGKAGIPAKALAAVKKAVELEPSSERFLYHQGLFALDSHPEETLGILKNHANSGDPWKHLEILLNLRERQPDLAYHSAQDITDEKGEVTFLKGISAMMQERHGLARELLHIALSKNPANPAIAYYLGCSYLRQNDLTTAAKLWEAAYAGGLRVPEIAQALVAAYYNQALESAAQQRVEELIACFQSILRLAPDSADEIRPFLALSYFLKANRTAETGGVAAALPLWQQALTAYEDLLRSASLKNDQPMKRAHYLDQIQKLYHNLALAYDMAEKVELAVLNWERLIKTWRSRSKQDGEAVQPDIMIGAYRHLADDYQKLGKLKEAMDAYNMALKYRPDQWELHEELGELSLVHEQWPAAIRHWSEVLRIKGPDAEAHTKLGLALDVSGQPKDALKHWLRALELEPQNQLAKKAILQSREPEILRHLERGRYDRALEVLSDLLKIIPDLPAVRVMMSDAYWGKGQRAHAMDQIEQAIALNPRDPGIWIEVIQSLLYNERPKELIAVVDGAESQFADDHLFYLNLAHAYVDFDRDRKAVQYYDKALEVVRRTHAQNRSLSEVLAKTAMEIAWKWVDLAEFAKARKYFKVAIDAQPDRAAYYYFLGCALGEDQMLAEAEKAWGRAEALAQAEGDEDLLFKIRSARASFTTRPDVPKDLEELMRVMRLLK